LTEVRRIARVVPPTPHGERNVSDKPAFIRSLPRIDPKQRRKIRRHMLCRAAALEEVDRGIGQLVERLRRLGEYDETVFIFYSDNGFFNGQHRVVKSKGLPYEEAIKVPAFIRVPARYLGAVPPRRLRLPTANIDLAPTILDLAGATPCIRRGCRRIDGRSLIGALDGTAAWALGREIMIEVDQRRRIAGGTLACSFAGIRTRRQVYIEYRRVLRPGSRRCRSTRDVEHYDLRRDRSEQRNLWPPRRPAATVAQARLRDALARLSRCNGNTHLDAALNPIGPGRNPCE
jgi:arylsulfatase A-like enzyme